MSKAKRKKVVEPREPTIFDKWYEEEPAEIGNWAIVKESDELSYKNKHGIIVKHEDTIKGEDPYYVVLVFDKNGKRLYQKGNSDLDKHILEFADKLKEYNDKIE